MKISYLFDFIHIWLCGTNFTFATIQIMYVSLCVSCNIDSDARRLTVTHDVDAATATA